MDLYLKVRRAHFQDGLSGRRIARDFGISRDSVSKMLAYSEPPGYRRTAPVKRPRLDGFTDQIDQWLLEGKVRPRKQRHTAKRVFERLPPKREGQKRLTLALDGDTYRRLRMHAAETDQTHQAILEAALAEYLKRVNA